MAKGRMLDKVIILSKKLNQVSEGAENLYYRILVCVDDFGRYHADPEIIKGQLYARRKISVMLIKKRLEELWKIGLIKLYEDDSEIYLEIVAFEKHQKFRSDVPQKAEYPEPKKFLQRSRNESDTSRNETERDETECCSNLSKDNLSKDNLKGDEIESEFEEFWKFYRSIGNPQDDSGDKQEAQKAYKILRRIEPKEKVAKATHGYGDHFKAELDQGFKKRKMYASTFLRSKKWERFLEFQYKARL